MKRTKAAVDRIMEPMEMPKPSMTVRSSQMPSIKGMQIGKIVGMHVKGKIKGINQDYDNPKVHRAEIEIHSIKPIKKGIPK